MAGGNQVTLTFAGDSTELTKAFDKVGAASKSMADDVGKSSKDIGQSSADGFDKAGEAADNVDTKAMGFRDTMTGVQDTGLGLSKIMKGELFDGFLTLGMGVGDLASGMFNFVIPAMKASSVSFVKNAASTTTSTVASVAHKVANVATAAATWALTAAQKALNVVLKANPIGLVITAIGLLVAGFIVAYNKSETFRKIVDGAMDGVKTAFTQVLAKGGDLFDWFKDLPGKITGAFGTLASAISSPFSTAFAGIKSLWNSTAGGFGFSIPDWVPKIGGNSFTIPSMHTGGVMPGAPGTQGLALLMAGERVSTPGQSGPGTSIEIRSGGSKLDDLLVEVLRGAIRRQGGDVQAVLGRA